MGKGIESKTSRIFQQCYIKCCKLQNLTPLNSVIPSGNGKVLDFSVDRIKYADWPPILNALSCDLSLHSISVRCRQQVKTVLEQIDCERLAKTVNKRAVILTNFMLNNLVEAIAQLLSNTTLLTSLLIEGLPLKIPYLNPLCESILVNDSLQYLYLPRCLIGDAGCLAICKAVRCLPNIILLDLSGCELTPLGAGYIADLIKYQKIHRYSENWIHTLRYRLPELDTMAGLRRITLCGNPQFGDAGVGKLLEVLADDLWIKAVDIQNCGLTEESANNALKTMRSNTTLVILDVRHNADLPAESLSALRSALRNNERGLGGQYSWLANGSCGSSDGRSVKSVAIKNGIIKDRLANTRNTPSKFTTKTNGVKKEKDYTDVLEDQLQEEVSHRKQLEELNQQLVDQIKLLKQQQMRLWTDKTISSGSEQSIQASLQSYDMSSSSGSSSSVPIDQNTLSYIQQAFKDIYAYIKNNQCHGQCTHDVKEMEKETEEEQIQFLEEISETSEMEEYVSTEFRINMAAKKARSAHIQLTDSINNNKITKSAHILGDGPHTSIVRNNIEMKPEMFEKQMGDSMNAHNAQTIVEEMVSTPNKPTKNSYDKSSPCSSVVSDSSDTLVCTPVDTQRSRKTTLNLNPREALYSSSDDENSS